MQNNYLQSIIDNKKHEVERLHETLDKNFFKKNNKSFKQAIQQVDISVIAEIKRRSPSKAYLADIHDPISLAKQYVCGGASAISLVTDHFAFQGSLNDLNQVAAALTNTSVVILRKDFIIDELQIIESINAGANAILLIVSILKEKTEALLSAAKKYGIDALVEVHDRQELDYAIEIGSEIIGINNRNLTTFEVNTENAIKLRPFIPDHIVSIAESGIHTLNDVKQLIDANFDALLIGEALVTSKDPGKFIRDIKGAACHLH